MAVYEYECTNPDCRARYEIFQHMGEREETTCTKCGRTTAKRVMSRPSFVVHGYNAKNGYAGPGKGGT